ncbi:arginine--tRNA ligase [Candidatus Woesearchaeota archaeon]|nr:arginine--tRNA ligase [Candidatus Woesearchaeota archaeon]
MNKAKKEIINLLKKETRLKDISLEVPKDPEHGDYAFPCFQLSKNMKKNPVEIAKELSKTLKPKKLIKEIKEAGPYINFYIDKQELAKSTIKNILSKKENYGRSKPKKEKIMVEFVSPNTNKSLHLGHVRNGILGESVSNIIEFSGSKVIRTCLNNDKGTGMTEAMLGYELFHKGETPSSQKLKPDHFVAQCYVDFKNEEKDNPDLKEKVQQTVKRWEEKDKKTRELWKKLTGWVYKGYKQTYKEMGFEFDKRYFESKIYKKGKDIVKKGLKKGIFVKEEKAVKAKLEKYNLPDKVLIKSDGTSLYMTQDLYLAKLKYEDFKIDKSIYVVASEQDNHFMQLFKILELLKLKTAKENIHLSYGLVNLPQGRMKSREGNIVDADDLIKEMKKLAKKEIKKRHKDISKKEIEKRAKNIAMGAIKFYMLKFDNVTSFTYDPEESLSFEGETGPYVQYAHARISSILKKYNKKIPKKINYSLLNTDDDKKLIFLLSKFPEEVENAAESYKPHLLARYLLDLSQAFNEFYHECPILQSDEDTKTARLNLILSVQQVLKNGLNLLGIEAPEAM